MNKVLIVFFLMLVSGSVEAQSQEAWFNTYTSDIIGIWVSEDDSNHKLEFTSDHTYNIYVKGDLVGSHYYKVVLDCGGNSNDFDVFLKTKDSPEATDHSCDIINNLALLENGKVILSLTTERGSLEVYYKE